MAYQAGHNGEAADRQSGRILPALHEIPGGQAPLPDAFAPGSPAGSARICCDEPALPDHCAPDSPCGTFRTPRAPADFSRCDETGQPGDETGAAGDGLHPPLPVERQVQSRNQRRVQSVPYDLSTGLLPEGRPGAAPPFSPAQMHSHAIATDTMVLLAQLRRELDEIAPDFLPPASLMSPAPLRSPVPVRPAPGIMRRNRARGGLRSSAGIVFCLGLYTSAIAACIMYRESLQTMLAGFGGA